MDSAELGPRGLAHDRRYMLVDSTGRFLTQRRHPRMALVETALDGDDLVISAPGREPLRLVLNPSAQSREVCSVRIWADTVEATLADAETNIWFSEFMGFACGLVHLADHQHRAIPHAMAEFDDEVSFADGAPVLLISDASLTELNRRLPVPMGMERFRPNIVVSADRPHAEDAWDSISIGRARLEVAWPCSRCALTTVDPLTGEPDPAGEPLRTLRQYRVRDNAVLFGQNLIPRVPGPIATGAECRIDGIIAE